MSDEARFTTAVLPIEIIVLSTHSFHLALAGTTGMDISAANHTGLQVPVCANAAQTCGLPDGAGVRE
jgi:hypothetical protein